MQLIQMHSGYAKKKIASHLPHSKLTCTMCNRGEMLHRKTERIIEPLRKKQTMNNQGKMKKKRIYLHNKE